MLTAAGPAAPPPSLRSKPRSAPQSAPSRAAAPGPAARGATGLRVGRGLHPVHLRFPRLFLVRGQFSTRAGAAASSCGCTDCPFQRGDHIHPLPQRAPSETPLGRAHSAQGTPVLAPGREGQAARCSPRVAAPGPALPAGRRSAKLRWGAKRLLERRGAARTLVPGVSQAPGLRTRCPGPGPGAGAGHRPHQASESVHRRPLGAEVQARCTEALRLGLLESGRDSGARAAPGPPSSEQPDVPIHAEGSFTPSQAACSSDPAPPKARSPQTPLFGRGTQRPLPFPAAPEGERRAGLRALSSPRARRRDTPGHNLAVRRGGRALAASCGHSPRSVLPAVPGPSAVRPQVSQRKTSLMRQPPPARGGRLRLRGARGPGPAHAPLSTARGPGTQSRAPGTAPAQRCRPALGGRAPPLCTP